MTTVSEAMRCKLCNFRMQNGFCLNSVCPNSKIRRENSGRNPSNAPNNNVSRNTANQPGPRIPNPQPVASRRVEGEVKTIFRYRILPLVFTLYFLVVLLNSLAESDVDCDSSFSITSWNCFVSDIDFGFEDEDDNRYVIMVIAFILLIISLYKLRTAITKKIVGIADNIGPRNVTTGAGRGTRHRQVISLRLRITGDRPRTIPAVYNHPTFNLRAGDLVEAYGHFRRSEFRIKKLRLKE